VTRSDEAPRPDPERFLRLLDRDARKGRLKVYLGQAAGVGKTWRMLDDALAMRERGIDIVDGPMSVLPVQHRVAQQHGFQGDSHFGQAVEREVVEIEGVVRHERVLVPREGFLERLPFLLPRRFFIEENGDQHHHPYGDRRREEGGGDQDIAGRVLWSVYGALSRV